MESFKRVCVLSPQCTDAAKLVKRKRRDVYMCMRMLKGEYGKFIAKLNHVRNRYLCDMYIHFVTDFMFWPKMCIAYEA